MGHLGLLGHQITQSVWVKPECLRLQLPRDAAASGGGGGGGTQQGSRTISRLCSVLGSKFEEY